MMKKKRAAAITPVEYGGLQTAFDHFNALLFKGALQDVMIVYQRRAHSFGHFAPDRFAVRAEHHRKQHELSLNPDGFHGQTDQQVCQTLVHEMAHLWQHMHGKPSKGGYHNREWAAKMKSIGLYPSNTGKPGGKETDNQMMDYVIPSGPFKKSFAELKKWRLNLQSAPRSGSTSGGTNSKTKFTCPSCQCNAWGKPDLIIGCLQCGAPMKAAQSYDTNSSLCGNLNYRGAIINAVVSAFRRRPENVACSEPYRF
jgi:predicted SprT family Zn-dependent metalloprotease